jgi:2-polyprenyl-3-methyl-5-hydroxy-6-metoxy-1,4-benzoquinol methylase
MKASDLLEMMNSAMGGAATLERPRAKRTEPVPVADTGLADRFDAMADKMQSAIDDKRAPISQNWTARRARIKDGQRADADRLEKLQTVLRSLAELHRADSVPGELRSIRTKAQAERALFPWMDRDAFKRDGFTPRTTEILEDLANADGIAERAKARAEASEREMRLRSFKRPGFFPTPDALAARMVDAAMIGAGDSVLEPSAGIGSLAIPLANAGALVQCVELDATIREELDARRVPGMTIAGDCDFLEIKPVKPWVGFDVVVMNPPFEKGAAWKHVTHAWRMLRPGGRLVALVPGGACKMPAEILDAAELDETIENAFKGADSLRQTGVRVRLIVAVKPE